MPSAQCPVLGYPGVLVQIARCPVCALLCPCASIRNHDASTQVLLIDACPQGYPVPGAQCPVLGTQVPSTQVPRAPGLGYPGAPVPSVCPVVPKHH